MASRANVALTDYFARFIERQVSEGRYASPEDVVQAGLRLLEEQEAKLEALRAALEEGEQSGYSTPFDFDEFLEQKLRDTPAS